MSDWYDYDIDENGYDDELEDDSLLDALQDSYRDEDADDDESDTVNIVTCKHCGGDELKLRSTDPNITSKVTFACVKCKKHTTIDLPYGYKKVYRIIE